MDSSASYIPLAMFISLVSALNPHFNPIPLIDRPTDNTFHDICDTYVNFLKNQVFVVGLLLLLLLGPDLGLEQAQPILYHWSYF